MLLQSKKSEGRIVYWKKSAKAAIQSLPVGLETESTGRPFSAYAPEQVSVSFLRVCRKLKIADFLFHDLRHAAASWPRVAGADIHTVAQILGHKDSRMAARNQRLSPAFMVEAAGRSDGVFELEIPPEVPQMPEAVEVEAVSLTG